MQKYKLLTISLIILIIFTMNMPVFAKEEKVVSDTNIETVSNIEDYIEATENKTGPAYIEVDTKTGTVIKNDKTKSFKSEFGINFSTVKGNNNKIEKIIEKNYAVTDNDGKKIEAANVFGSRKLILKTNKDNIVSNNAEKGVYYDSEYTFIYQDEEATENAFIKLAKRYGANNVYIDYPVKACNTEKSSSLSWGFDFMNFETALNKNFCHSKRKQPIKVAVIDSGIDKTHPIFKGRSIFTKSFLDYTDDINDYAGHGTATTGIITESTPSNVSIMSLRALNLYGVGYVSEIINAVDYAVQNKADIINLSLSYSLADIINETRKELKKQKISYTKKDEEKFINDSNKPYRNAYNKGTLVVAAAGNENADYDKKLCYPAASPQVISAGSIDQDGKRASFSNYGATLDFTAPGKDLNLPSSWYPIYQVTSGTSFSAPYITAAAANINSLDKNMSNAHIKHELIKISKKFNNYSKKYFGYGTPVFPNNYDLSLFMTIRALNYNSVNVYWNSFTNANKYIVVLKKSNGSVIKRIPTKKLSLTVTGLKSKTLYKISVSAFKDGKLISNSNNISFKTKDAPCTGKITIKKINKSKYTIIKWNKAKKATKYIVQTSVNKSNWHKVATIKTTSYKIKKLKKGKILYVRVIPCKKNKKSLPSNIVLIRNK